MKMAHKTFSYQTKELFDFIDATDEIRKFVQGSGVQNGLVNIQIMHTSAALIVNEYEPLLLGDMKRNLEATASRKLEYQHDDFSIRTVNVCDKGEKNGHSHCKAIHLLPSVTLNLIDGELQLGQWQSIILVELDCSRPRKIQVEILGE